MATQKSDLAIVLSWLVPHSSSLRAAARAFKSRGIDAHCPQLPTADLAKLNVGDINIPDYDREPPPAGGYSQGEEDSQVVLSVLKPLVEEGKQVLLIGHSSGGWVATDVARPDLQAKSRASNGLPGGILYMGTFVIPVGESITSFFQPKYGQAAVTPPFNTFGKHGFAGLGTMVEAEKLLFQDLDPAEAQKWTPGLTPSPILATKRTDDAYSALPCAYLVLDGDLALPKEYQEGMRLCRGQ